jgi:hypothetical protein
LPGIKIKVLPSFSSRYQRPNGIVAGPTTNVGNSIIAGNGAGGNGPDVDLGFFGGTFTSQGHNLIGNADGSTAFNATGDQVGTGASPLNPRLAPLANNGGLTHTHALLSNSPAIDNGHNSLATAAGLTTDQRGTGFPRFVDGNGDTIAAVDIGAFELNPAHNLTVNILGDAADVTLDGNCDTDLGSAGSQCTLRAAIQETNSIPGDDIINFSLPPNSTITLNTSLPDIDDDLIVTGPGASLLTVNRSTAVGTPNFRIFTITPGNTVTIAGLTISNGNAVGGSFPAYAGGGILSNNAQVTLNNLIVSGNSASFTAGGIDNTGGTMTINFSVVDNNTSPSGGGISNNGVGTLKVNNSTISNNHGAGAGGLYNVGTATVTNSTISSNDAVNGGGVPNVGALTLVNVTIAGNNATSTGGGIHNPGIGTLTFSNTLIGANSAPSGPDCSGGNFDSQDYNFIGNTSGASFSGTTTHNITNVNPNLGPLDNNGGPTQTHALLSNSPAIDKGNNLIASNAGLVTDQHGAGFPRIADGDNDPTATVDIGAFEVQLVHGLVVNRLGDAADAVLDGNCDTDTSMAGSQCTLRAAIQETNYIPGADTITFSLPFNSSITLNSALDAINGNLTITGPSANLLTVERSNVAATNFRIFHINPDKTVRISRLTIANGYMPGAPGGGVLNDGNLTLANCNLYGNTAGSGGGVVNGVAAVVNLPSLTINHCTIGGTSPGLPNTASQGGGVYNNFGLLTVALSSINGNSGGGVFVDAGAAAFNGVEIYNNTTSQSGGGVYTNIGTTSITNSLIAGNSSTTGAGIAKSRSGQLTVANSTVSGNSSTGNGAGIASLGGQLNLTNVTVANNRSDSDNSGGEAGGGLYVENTPPTLKNTIVAGNFRGSSPGNIADDINGPVDPASSFNLIGTGGSGGLVNAGNNNQVGVSNPRLGPLANNLGQTQTHALLFNSPARDAGNNSFANAAGLTMDQRGTFFPRIIDGNLDAIATVDIGAFEANPSHQLTVNTLGDAADVTLDGNCDTDTLTAESGSLTLTGVTVSNNTAGDSGVGTLANGGLGGHGGAINIEGGIVTLTNSTLSGNKAGVSASGTNGFAGAIQNSGTLTITGSTVSGNTGNAAGAILNRRSLKATNSTFSGNTTLGSGAALFADGDSKLSLTNCTITENNLSGVAFHSVPPTIGNTILARNGSGGNGPDAIGTFNSQGYNLVGNADQAPGFNAVGDQVGHGSNAAQPAHRSTR